MNPLIKKTIETAAKGCLAACILFVASQLSNTLHPLEHCGFPLFVIGIAIFWNKVNPFNP